MESERSAEEKCRMYIQQLWPKNESKIEVKLYVSHIPAEWEDPQVSEYFTKYLEILDTKVIKDKSSGTHKGSAFIRCASLAQAEKFIKEHSGSLTLPGAAQPIHAKYAEGEPERLGLVNPEGIPYTKLFIGSIPKAATEEQIRQVFAPYGSIEEFYMFIDKETHIFKGCAFVKFSGKDSCLKAIEALNGKFLMNGSEKPLEVRWAEVKSKKQAMTKMMMEPKPTTMSSYYPMYYPVQQPQPVVQPPQFVEYFTAEGAPYYYNVSTQKTQWERPLNETSIMTVTQFQQLFSNTQASPSNDAKANSGVQGQKQGPKGANLFIFHVPNQWDDADILKCFQAYGEVLSARIMKDKATGRSRGFGFVSYDNSQSAESAIKGMNGYAVHGKRLKVQLKKGDGDDLEKSMISLDQLKEYAPY